MQWREPPPITLFGERSPDATCFVRRAVLRTQVATILTQRDCNIKPCVVAIEQPLSSEGSGSSLQMAIVGMILGRATNKVLEIGLAATPVLMLI